MTSDVIVNHDVEIMDCASFSMKVEEAARDSGEGYIPAVLEVIDTYGIDVKDVKKFLSKSLIQKLEAEAIDDGMMKGTTTKLTAFFV